MVGFPVMPPEIRAPEDMRRAVAAYVSAAHGAYLRALAPLPPALAGGLPLVTAGSFSVAAAGAADLHVVATLQPLGPPPGASEIAEVEGECGPLRWRLRFYDPVVLPELGLVTGKGAQAAEAVRRVLGMRTWLYHLVVQPGSQLTEHHATHAGTALAHAHAAAARDFEAIRAHARGRQELVTEMEGAALAGLVRAQALLAQAIAPRDAGVDAAAGAAEPDPDELRRALLAAVRGRP